MESVKEDSITKEMLTFHKFFSDSKPKISAESKQNPANERIHSTKFVRAQTALKSNPFHLEPITNVESMEDVLEIKNVYERKDQLRWV